MAFINTVIQRVSGSMWCWEHGTWEMTDATTSGTIFPATSGQGINGGIRELGQTTFWSDDAHELAKYLPSNMASVTVYDAAADQGTTGRYTLIGRMA